MQPTYDEAFNSIVTDAVVRALMNAHEAITEEAARERVGGNAEAFLRSVIDERVALGISRDALEQSMQERFLGPARRMLEIMAGEPEPDPVEL